MTSWPKDFVLHKIVQMTPLSELPAAVVPLLPEFGVEEKWQGETPIYVVTTSKKSIRCDTQCGHYFMGGLPALMQAARLLQKEPTASVCYVNDGQLKKSTQSAHQGHVHPTEWTTPELGTQELLKVLLGSLYLYPATSPDDVVNYSYIHLPLSKMKLSLFVRNMAFRVVHTLLSKNGVSEDDRWQ